MSIKENKHKSTGEMEKMHWDGWVCATSAGYLLGDGNVNEGLKQHMVTFWDPSGFDFIRNVAGKPNALALG